MSTGETNWTIPYCFRKYVANISKGLFAYVYEYTIVSVCYDAIIRSCR